MFANAASPSSCQSFSCTIAVYSCQGPISAADETSWSHLWSQFKLDPSCKWYAYQVAISSEERTGKRPLTKANMYFTLTLFLFAA